MRRRTLLILLAILKPSVAFADDEDMTVATGNLNVNQVYQLLLNNGATQQAAATLAGISVWEAGGGNPNAINPKALNNNASTDDYSVGLFQYNFRAGNFNSANPMASTRGGFSPGDLLNSLNAQAQSALALLQTQGFGAWTTYRAHLSSIQSIANQLIGSSTPDNSGGTTDTTPGQTGISSGVSGETGVQTNPTSGLQSSSNPGQPTSMNLSFSDSIQHSIVQFLLVIVGIALLVGGIYLIGSSHK